MGRNLMKYLFMKRQVSRTILSGNFKMLDSLNKGDVLVSWFRRYVICKDVFCKAKSFSIEFEFSA